MSFRISDFRAALGAGSRPNLFKVRISGPSGYDLAEVEVLCRSASLPSSTMGTIEIPMNAGRRLKMGGDRTFTEWTSTILNDENFKSRSVLEKWQNDIVKINFGKSVVGNRNAGTLAALSGGTVASRGSAGKTNGLYGTVEIFQLREDGSSVDAGEYRLINCWPSDISSIDLSYDTTDSVEDFTVTWSFDYFEIGSALQTSEAAG
jgi:hypothetical protein